MIDVSPQPLAPPPPAFAVRAILGLRRWLVGLADRLLPPELAAFEHVIGFGETVMLREVARLGVPDRLEDGPRDAGTLAGELGVDADVLHRVLRCLASRGVFTLDAQGRFANGHVARGLLSGPGTGRTFAAYIGDRHNLLAWDRLDEVLREGGDGFTRSHGEVLWSWYEHEEEAHERFAAMMADQTLGDAAAVAVGYPWRGRVCDVGGGIGTQLSEILVRDPSVRGMLVDSPRTLERARELLGRRRVLERVQLEPGSFFDPLPTGADVYLLKNVLHDWGDEASTTILRRVRDAMKPDAKLVIAESIIDRNDPLHPAVVADVHMMMLCPGGRERSVDELRDLLAACGLRMTRVVHTPVFMGLVEAERA